MSEQQRKIAVCGFAEGHLHEAPFDDPTWELWGINRLHMSTDAKFDVWFNIHDLEKFHGQDTEHLEFLKNFDGPVFLRPQDIGKYDIPNGQPFPWSHLVDKYGRYFNNTISWLVAFALEQQPSDLGVYGVDMAQDGLLNAEYSHQRPSCEYFLGLAAGAGVQLHLPAGSDLLKATHLYGFEDADPFTQKLLNRLQELGQRKEKVKAELAQVDGHRSQLVNAINQMDGAMQDVQFVARNWLPLTPGDIVPLQSENNASSTPNT